MKDFSTRIQREAGATMREAKSLYHEGVYYPLAETNGNEPK